MTTPNTAFFAFSFSPTRLWRALGGGRRVAAVPQTPQVVESLRQSSNIFTTLGKGNEIMLRDKGLQSEGHKKVRLNNFTLSCRLINDSYSCRVDLMNSLTLACSSVDNVKSA